MSLRNFVWMLMAISGSGCSLGPEPHETSALDAAVPVDAPFVSCDGTYFVDFDVREQVQAISIERRTSDFRYRVESGCYASASVPVLWSHGCSMFAGFGERLAFNVIIYPTSMGDPDDARAVCRFDIREESSFGDLRVRCGSAPVTIDRVPSEGGCAFVVR